MNQREPLEFVFLTTNRKTAKKSVTRKIYKLYIKLDITRERNLFLFRECLIVQSLAMGISQIVYSASLLDISPDNISRNKRAIFNFIYNIASKFVWSNSIAWACFIFLLCTLMTSANKSLEKKKNWNCYKTIGSCVIWSTWEVWRALKKLELLEA